MASTKETPRQKMISLMYIILTCLLALNVSQEVLKGFVHINESIETTNANFTNNTEKIMEAINDAIKQGRKEFIPYYSKAQRSNLFTQKAYVYLDSLKKEVIKYTEDKSGADTLTLAEVKRLDNYDKPTFFLMGSDELNPKNGKYSASELKQTMINLSDSLEFLIDGMKNKTGLKLPDDDYNLLKGRIKSMRPLENYTDEEGNPIKWEYKNFYNQPLAAVVTNLSKIQSDIRNIEGEMVNVFASAPGKLSVNFNQMQARIVPMSHYIQSGSPYTADVFLSAASTDFKDDNLQFILGEMDTATGVIAQNATILPIDQGTGKISVPTSGVGDREINGWIKFRDGTGKYNYFKYTSDYVVANAAVAISPDKMNVFYGGVDNPLTVSAAGVAPTNLVVEIKGCNGKLKNLSNGKYMVNVSGPGSCTVSVFKKLNGTLVQQGTPQTFRVKRFPSPPLRISGKTVIDNLNMSVSETKNLQSIGLDVASIDFDAPFKVLEFSIGISIESGKYESFACKGNKLSPQALLMLSRIKKGSKIFIEDIKVQSPEDVRSMPMVKITVK
jgi:gliding motility-associated protein GldM